MTNPTTSATAGIAPQMRNRGVVQLDEEILAQMFDLPKGQRVIGFRADPLRLCIDIHIEGEGLPETHPGELSRPVNVGQFVTPQGVRWAARGKDLAEMVAMIAAELEGSVGDAPAYGADLRRILDGSYDPRVRYSTVAVVVEYS